METSIDQIHKDRESDVEKKFRVSPSILSDTWNSLCRAALSVLNFNIEPMQVIMHKGVITVL